MPAARSQVTHHGRLQKLAKERNRRKRTFQRRLELETLELRYLLTSVVEPVQADALAVPDLLLETLVWEAPVEAAAWWEDAPVAAEDQVQDVKVLERELPTDEDAAIGIEVASFEEGVPVEIALLSDDESFADEMLKVVPLRTAAFGAFEDGSVETTGEMPMLMAFGAVEDVSVETTDEMPLLMAFGAVEDVSVETTDEMPMLMAFGAVEDVGVETTDEMPMLMAFGAVEDVSVETTDEMPVLMAFGAVEDVSVQKADDGQDESPLLRTLLTSEVSEDAGSDVPVRMYSMAGSDETAEALDVEMQLETDGGAELVLLSDSTADSELMLTAVDSLEEMMLLSAMGPSPWQNLNDPDDVNVDGWTTARDALLVINRINDGVPLSALAAPVTLFVDVNGDRNLDAGDAAQVINTLNGAAEAPLAVEEANRVAPLWFDSGVDESAAWEDGVATDEADNAKLGDESLDPDAARMAVLPVADETDPLDASSEDVEKEDAIPDESLLFAEDTDWLMPELV